MSLYALDRHKRACRMLGFTLTVGDDPGAWVALATVLFARLTPQERAALAFAALSTIEPDARESVFSAAQWGEVE
ncbi:hypothetical protein SAMN05421763_10227 [[Luteovulum] sphaeroides subsp. megalophilum]|uniref:hypothetical protein n=1 Tax=Cereibacter sphaeroides TaxID=1063 RepID=UPI000B73CB59|nr:hypothetical protein [Cereibacter sphaeroides]SNS50981.1 hypothetical protein SAMN05421763_10227 [[Luteovulum] sphaeroides subsp. megalophilum]